MTKRTIKQLIIAFIFILILSGLGFLIYYISRPSPTCFDNIQNQTEEGIDCGGPCSPCELVHIKEIEVIWAKAIPVQNDFYDLAAQIKNPNQNYGSGQIPFQFELYDSKNNLIGHSSGSTYILPNQTKYLLQTRVKSSGAVSQLKLSFGQIQWQKPEDEQPPQLVIQQKEYRLLPSQETGFSQARAVLTNKTNFDFDKIDIDILLFDSSRRLLAVGNTEIRTLLAGQERDFVFTWFNQIAGQISFVEMEAETNVFDPSNYLPAKRGEGERFQEY